MNHTTHYGRSMLWASLLMLCSMFVLPAEAQQEQKRFTVRSFHQDRLASTAQNPKYSRTDSDGRLYAIVKVRSNAGDDLKAYSFEFGLMTHETDGIHDDGALWIYVKRNARYVTIRREGYAAVTNHDLGQSLEEGGTYEMRISAQAGPAKKRSLMFEVTPASVQAVVKVKREGDDGNYEIWGRVDASGRLSKIIETGVWLYEITAANYQPSTGRVALEEGSSAQRERVALLPAYGFLEVDNPAGVTEAEIYVDDSFIGITPYKDNGRNWDIGEHRIVVKKGELYSDYIATFTIKPGETTRLMPQLRANFAQTTITVDADADIYIDGELKGNKSWSGPLRAGTYTVECRQEKHRTASRQITVRQGYEETFTMEPPTPITGMLYINTAPVGATVSIDGKQAGTTPFDQQLLIGQYGVVITMDGYQKEARTVDIDDGAEEMLNLEMQQIVTQKMISLVEAGLSVGSMMGAEVGAGLRFGKVSMELSYTLGLGKSDPVYWNYDTDTQPVECVYKPSAIALRLGYALGKGSLQFTPQVGLRILTVSSEAGDSKCNATSTTLGLRLDYRLAKSVSLFAAPEMGFAVSKSNIYEQVADVASDVKGWGTGFQARAGVCISF